MAPRRLCAGAVLPVRGVLRAVPRVGETERLGVLFLPRLTRSASAPSRRSALPCGCWCFPPSLSRWSFPLHRCALRAAGKAHLVWVGVHQVQRRAVHPPARSDRAVARSRSGCSVLLWGWAVLSPPTTLHSSALSLRLFPVHPRPKWFRLRCAGAVRSRGVARPPPPPSSCRPPARRPARCRPPRGDADAAGRQQHHGGSGRRRGRPRRGRRPPGPRESLLQGVSAGGRPLGAEAVVASRAEVCVGAAFNAALAVACGAPSFEERE